MTYHFLTNYYLLMIIQIIRQDPVLVILLATDKFHFELVEFNISLSKFASLGVTHASLGGTQTSHVCMHACWKAHMSLWEAHLPLLETNVPLWMHKYHSWRHKCICVSHILSFDTINCVPRDDITTSLQFLTLWHTLHYILMNLHISVGAGNVIISNSDVFSPIG